MEFVAWLAFCVVPPILFALQKLAKAQERIAAALERAHPPAS